MSEEQLSEEDKRTAHYIKACCENYSRKHGFNQQAEAILYLMSCLNSSEEDIETLRARAEAAERERDDWRDRVLVASAALEEENEADSGVLLRWLREHDMGICRESISAVIRERDALRAEVERLKALPCTHEEHSSLKVDLEVARRGNANLAAERDELRAKVERLTTERDLARKYLAGIVGDGTDWENEQGESMESEMRKALGLEVRREG